MEKYNYKAKNGVCLELCKVRDNGIKIGSFSCRICKHNGSIYEDTRFNARFIECKKLKEALWKNI